LPLRARIGLAIHSVVLLDFQHQQWPLEMTVTVKWSSPDGGYRGNKTIDLKGIIDDALVNTPCVANVVVVKERTAPST
jgi:acetyl-CoA synthetase